MASYRYRVKMPVEWLGASINDFTAETLVFSKPQPFELENAKKAVQEGKKVVVDFCDDHFDFQHYEEFLKLAHTVVCPTANMQDRIGKRWKFAHVIPESYEYPELQPHCRDSHLLWFGHSSNLKSLLPLLPKLTGYPLRIVSNVATTAQWSHGMMFEEFARADIFILPATAAYKSANRAVEAIRQGCFVVAEHHPSLDDLPIWKGNILEGIQWAYQHTIQANLITKRAQNYVIKKFAPEILASAWKKALEFSSISDAGKSSGTDGSELISTELTSIQT